MITGMPAVGKSTFARELAQRTGACLIDIDSSTEPIIRPAMSVITGDADDRDSPTFKKTFREAIYSTLFSIANENLPHTHCIIAAPFTKELKNPRWPEDIQAKLSTKCRIKCVYLRCDSALRKQRMNERANPRDTSKLVAWEKHQDYYENDSFPAYPHLLVDTGKADSFQNAVANGLFA